MENIISISGNVKFPITLDPGVWIFDDRRVDLNTYFDEAIEKTDALEEYTKSISKHWDREIMEGAIYPPTLKSEKKFEKEKVLTGTFGIPLAPFIKNAEPNEDASSVIIISRNGEEQVSLEDAMGMILGFSKEGKPLKEDGPIHAYFGDGSNSNSPFKNISSFQIK
ncbi:peptidyl-prolyl cis-trans isomerase [Cytobacillus gottheilii]|uniref:Peptidyl-prolyl cis-trans isomerase n=1 Tax=Cytobacillus gottheilii TaxID=859144 RepID=A0ABX8FGM2_9BACI|nr:peptidyl-prolyl cis-trans isomerase [Cytobacillus gottheilii]QVY63147.1 peptidyl-prolyl cis-trans isomerase [Cytobacillus gottheilii]